MEKSSKIGGELEEILENTLPKSTVKEVKKRPVVYISLILLLLAIVIGFYVGLTKAKNELKKERDATASLNLELQKSSNELEALQENLSKTEEGRKQLEQAKAQVDDQNKQLDIRATSAEQVATKAKSDLAKVQSELSSKQAELSRVASELSGKQAELAKAQRGVALFAQTETLFNTYDSSAATLIAMIVDPGDTTQAQFEAELNRLNDTYYALRAIFDKIESGNY